MCSQLINNPTIPEHQIVSRIEKIIDHNSKDEADNRLMKAKICKESKWITNLIIHDIHENTPSQITKYEERTCIPTPSSYNLDLNNR